MDSWYPAQGNGELAGLWYPKHPDGTEIPMGFESAAACMRYLTRSGLAPGGVHMRKHGDRPPVTISLDKVSDQLMPSRETEADEAPTCRHNQAKQRCAVCTAPPGAVHRVRHDLVETTSFAGKSTWIKGRCHHLEDARHPVDNRITGELLAWWCSDCGEQSPPERWPCPEGMWLPLPEIQRGKILGVSFAEPDRPDFVDTYTDERLIGTAHKVTVMPPSKCRCSVCASRDVWEIFTRMWDALKWGTKNTWPIWLAISWMLISAVSEGRFP